MLQTPADQIGNDLPLVGPDGLGLDSIDALELVVSMEKTFGVGVPNSEVASQALQTVNSIHDYIVEKDRATGSLTVPTLRRRRPHRYRNGLRSPRLQRLGQIDRVD